MRLMRESEEERIRREDLARSYSELKKLYAGKHLLGNIDRYIAQAQSDEDSIDIRDLTSNEVAFYRGVRHGLMRAKKDIELGAGGGS